MNKRKLKKYVSLGILIIIITISSILIYINQEHKIYLTNEFIPKVLIIYKEGTNNYLDAYNNYKQGYLLNTKVSAIADSNLEGTIFTQYDVIYPDVSLLTSQSIPNIKNQLISYVENGGNLFLEYEWQGRFKNDFTGVISSSKSDISSSNFSYPKINYNLKGLQLVLQSFTTDLSKYRSEELDTLELNTLTLATTAKSIINLNNKSVMSINKYKNGNVLFASNLFPNKKFITGFDLTSKNKSQKYFDYSFAAINSYVRNEFLSFAVKEKYGFSLKKIYGPYNRPAMAWQNHYEALSSIKDKEMIQWIDLLKEYNQIPSVSLLRSVFDWGKWQSSITVHTNLGQSKDPKFIGETANSYYSSGNRITLKNDYLTFGEYPDYTSLRQNIRLPERAYPSIIDYDSDGDIDLLVGSPDGMLYLVKNNGTNKAPAFVEKTKILLDNNTPIDVGKYSSPTIYDINGDNLFDLLLGSDSGIIKVFMNSGTKSNPKFASSSDLSVAGSTIKVEGPSTISFGDINGDKQDDLIVGSSDGKVYFYNKTVKGFLFHSIIINSNDKFISPTIYDWNNDGNNDILVGDNSGYIKVYLNDNNSFKFNCYIDGTTKNMYGNNHLLFGHNSVPLIYDWNDDGKKDLIVGGLEFGISYDIDSDFFKYKDELKEIIAYANEHGVPIYPHLYIHKYKTKAQEETEINLSKQAFQYYNLFWNDGADQHTWQTNEDNPTQTLYSQMNSGIWWNFGYNPPSQPDLPRDGKEYMWSIPFMLTNNTNTNNFISYTPSPNLNLYPDVYESFSKFDMPIISFEHIEYRFREKDKLDFLRDMASSLESIQENSDYNFVTQSQMAKSFINAFYAKGYVKVSDKKITINPDFSDIPDLAGVYKGTLGLKVEKGEKYRGIDFSTTSDIYFEKDDELYFSADKKVELLFNNNSATDQKLHIIRCNVPIEIESKKDITSIKFLDSGMQQIKLKSKQPLKIDGEKLKVKKDGDFYTVTHYGYPITIKIEANIS